MKARLTQPVTRKQIIDAEYEKAWNELLDRRSLDLDTAVLFTLHCVFGKGKVTLRRYYVDHVKHMRAMLDRYDDVTFDRMRAELLKIGVDVKAWYEELYGEGKT